MAQGQQRLETKQITGQVITHTIVKPLQDPSDISKEQEAKLADALDGADTTSE
ncbi:hypothetical protein GCM10018790_46210 [Kitasatospora xanthocidica]|uniref:hypothetical protein n=1 Tax=Kitasatospora xanthocidica TaxID=83382 RepID=UPI0016762F1D|nr:hypothetical protein [Kitasatospora xanthocidica]GHF63138.1 hypothetical protein GCM10018790_46210 [Kitasatospora xanthocidica]